MTDREFKERLQKSVNSTLSCLEPSARQCDRIVQETLEGKKVMKKHISFALVLAILLASMAVGAGAVSLAQYFQGFAALENVYGEYEEWPASAKVELAQTMMDSGVLPVQDAWQSANEQEKEALAEKMLDEHFDGLYYIDLSNAMEWEIGPMEGWPEEMRALYSELLAKYGKAGDDWPVYRVPGPEDVGKQEAIAISKNALLDKFPITEAELNAYQPIETWFASEKYNEFGIPEDEPFWRIQFDYSSAYRVVMTHDGQIIAITAPGLPEYILWGHAPQEEAQVMEPGSADASREEAIERAEDGLTEVVNLPLNEVEAMTATAQFLCHPMYCHGEEPVWIVTWSRAGVPKWRVLLGHDGSYIDAAPADKEFLRVRRTDEQSLGDIWDMRCGEIGMMPEDDERFPILTLEEQARFTDFMRPIVEAYAAEHPYYQADSLGWNYWQRTRNVLGVPTDAVLSREQALKIAQDELASRGVNGYEDAYTFYVVTNPDRPEWRFTANGRHIAIDAKTGEVLFFGDAHTVHGYDGFLEIVLP